jgi:thiamine-phosphate pyrophosphorylase
LSESEQYRLLLAGLRLYLVADPDLSVRPLEETVAAALDGGVTAVQLRAKSLTDREHVALARRIRSLCQRAGVLFFVNDRVDIALAAHADGVHLGADDLSIEDARIILGNTMMIGYSPDTDDQAASARKRGADYLGVGPVFGTASKSDAGIAIGLETLRRRVAAAGVPVIGIGGITPDNALSVARAGAAGVAVVSAIVRASDPRAASMELRKAIDSTYRPQRMQS